MNLSIDKSNLNKVINKGCRNSNRPSNFQHVIAYISDRYLLEETIKIPNIGIRNKMVASLIEAYNLLPLMKCVESVAVSDEELTSFHSSSYIEYLKTVEEDTDNELLGEFGIGYDCPPVADLYRMVCKIAGGTLTAARQLTSGGARVAINWCGGWHHAQRDEAEGFCYVNDIVIGIEELRKKFPKVLYIDLDIHHGNGVQNAYYYTSRVFTVSFHKYEPGFYPTTGELGEVGDGPGRYYTINVPLAQGLVDSQLTKIYQSIVGAVKVRYRPAAVVLQCGGDCLSGDPVGNWNLTEASMGYCLVQTLAWGLPTLVLGGGGYNHANTARCWTYLTALICKRKLCDEIPDNKYFSHYGPGFDLEISPGRVQNLNHNIEKTIASILSNLKHIPENED